MNWMECELYLKVVVEKRYTKAWSASVRFVLFKLEVDSYCIP